MLRVDLFGDLTIEQLKVLAPELLFGVEYDEESGLLRSSNCEPPRSLGTPTPPYDPASNPWHMPFDPSWTYGKPAGADAVKPKKRPGWA